MVSLSSTLGRPANHGLQTAFCQGALTAIPGLKRTVIQLPRLCKPYHRQRKHRKAACWRVHPSFDVGEVHVVVAQARLPACGFNLAKFHIQGRPEAPF